MSENQLPAYTLDETVAALNKLRSADGPRPRIVFTNGVFDLPHPGHLRSLQAARALGDILVVGVNSDESVRRLKGPLRPVLPQHERAKILASFEMVDFVVIFTEDTPHNIVQALQPDIIAKGEEYRGREVVGSDIVLARGGSVEYLPMQPDLSTTNIVERILQSQKQS